MPISTVFKKLIPKETVEEVSTLLGKDKSHQETIKKTFNEDAINSANELEKSIPNVTDMQPNVHDDINNIKQEQKFLSGTLGDEAQRREIENLSNVSNRLKAEESEVYNVSNDIYSKQADELLSGLSSDKQKYEVRQQLDDMHSIGLDSKMIEDIANGEQNLIKKNEFKNEVVNSFLDIDKEVGLELADRLHLLEKELIDPKFVNANREKYKATVAEIVDDAVAKIESKGADTTDIRNAFFHNATNEYKDDFITALEDAIVYGAFKNYDSMLGRQSAQTLKQLIRQNPKGVSRMFKSRDIIKEETKKRLFDVNDELTYRTKRPVYSPPQYNVQGRTMIVKANEVDKMKDTIGGKFKIIKESKPFYLRENNASVQYKEITIKDFENQHIQGAVKYNKHKERGTTQDISEESLPINYNTPYIQANNKTYRVDSVNASIKGAIIDKDTKEVIKEYEVPLDSYDAKFLQGTDGNFILNKHQAELDNLVNQMNKEMEDLGNKGKYILDVNEKYTAKDIHRYLERVEEEELLQKDRDIVSNVSRYFAKSKSERNEAKLKKLIDKDYTSIIDKDNIDNFMLSLNTEKYFDSKFLFINLNDEAFKTIKDNSMVTKFAENYVLAPKNSRLSGKYIRKEYAQEMFGFEKFMVSDGNDLTGRFLEEMYDLTVGFARESVALKNPVVLANNFMSNSFMMIANGLNPISVFKGYPKALNELKQMHELRSQLISLEVKHGIGKAELMPEYQELKRVLNHNIAQEAKDAGVLKSLIDDGLWDRYIRDNPNEPFSHKLLKNILMTQDSKLGVKVRHATDTVDMMGRLVSYKLHKQKFIEQGLSDSQASKKASQITDDLMVNYNRLQTPSVMFLRDKGLMPFITWYQRSFPVMYKVFNSNKLRVASMIGLWELMEEQYGNGESGFFGVRTESMNPYKAITPEGVAGSFSFLLSDPTVVVPQVYKHIYDGDIGKVLGVTTGDKYDSN